MFNEYELADGTTVKVTAAPAAEAQAAAQEAAYIPTADDIAAAEARVKEQADHIRDLKGPGGLGNQVGAGGPAKGDGRDGREGEEGRQAGGSGVQRVQAVCARACLYARTLQCVRACARACAAPAFPDPHSACALPPLLAPPLLLLVPALADLYPPFSPIAAPHHTGHRRAAGRQRAQEAQGGGGGAAEEGGGRAGGIAGGVRRRGRGSRVTPGASPAGGLAGGHSEG